MALTEHGLTVGLLDELDGLMAELEKNSVAKRTGTQGHMVARAGLERLGSELVGFVRVLDGIYRCSSDTDEALLAAWQLVCATTPGAARSRTKPVEPM